MSEEMKREIVDTVDNFCKNFCKYSNGVNNKCVWEEAHAGECPFRKLLGEIEKCE